MEEKPKSKTDRLRECWVDVKRRMPPVDNIYYYAWDSTERAVWSLTGGNIHDRINLTKKGYLMGGRITHWCIIVSPFPDVFPTNARERSESPFPKQNFTLDLAKGVDDDVPF